MTTAPDAHAEVFAAHRGAVFGAAYRLLGTVTDAEDTVSECWLRWQRVDPAVVDDPRAYLVTVATRLSLDVLRSARVRRETYVGPWLPEPVVADRTGAPEDEVAVAEEVSLALLVVLETLSPAERAVFVLREAFGFDYPAIAAALDRSEDACRQLASRARRHVRDQRPRYDADPAEQRALLDRFLAAGRDGDVDGLVALLADDAVLTADGGGVAAAALHPVVGAERIVRFLLGAATKTGAGAALAYEPVTVNGRPGLLATIDGVPDTVVDVDVADGRITALRLVRNPVKLARLSPRGPSPGPLRGQART